MTTKLPKLGPVGVRLHAAAKRWNFRISPLALLVGAALAGNALPAIAVTDGESNTLYQFSFVPPGARSLGMGGAFLGRADDATAAYTNPAGLTQLVQPEISAEGRHTNNTAEFASGGTFAISPFDLSNVDYDGTENSVNGLAFFSFVWPHDRWSLAFYRHELVNYEVNYALVDDLFASDIDDYFILPYGALLELDVTNYGLSGAFKVSDTFSIGASILYSDFELDSVVSRVTAVVPFSSTETGDDDAFAFNIGALFEVTDRLQVGAVYRDGPEFDTEADLLANDGSGGAPGFPKPTKFDTPDIFGVGLSFQPSDAWIVTFDVNRIYYSDLTDDLNSGFRANDAADLPSIEPLQIDDGTEVRLGAEYTFLDAARPFSLRGGVWHDPVHTIQFEGDPITDTGSNAIANAVIFSTGDDEIHWTFGAGIVFGRFQMDAAFDFSDTVDTFSISGVLRFE